MSSTALNPQGSNASSGLHSLRNENAAPKAATSGAVVVQVASPRFQNPMEEQREFINTFIHRYMEEGMHMPGATRQQVQEMESVLYSVSFGKQDLFKKAQFQAYSAAISSQSHVDLVMKYIN